MLRLGGMSGDNLGWKAEGQETDRRRQGSSSLYISTKNKNDPNFGKLTWKLEAGGNVKSPLSVQMDKMSVLHKDILMTEPQPLSR